MIEDNIKSLQENLQLLEAIQDSTTVANLALSADYKILSFNRRLRSFILKYWTHDISIGELVTDFIHPDNLEDFKKEFDQALTGKVVSGEHQFTTLQGQKMWIEVAYHPVKISPGYLKKVAISFRNITRERLYEEKITAQNKKLKEVAFVSAHQLRGPITSLISLTSLLSDDTKNPDDSEFYIQKIKELSIKIDAEIRSLVGKTEEI